MGLLFYVSFAFKGVLVIRLVTEENRMNWEGVSNIEGRLELRKYKSKFCEWNLTL